MPSKGTKRRVQDGVALGTRRKAAQNDIKVVGWLVGRLVGWFVGLVGWCVGGCVVESRRGRAGAIRVTGMNRIHKKTAWATVLVQEEEVGFSLQHLEKPPDHRDAVVEADRIRPAGGTANAPVSVKGAWRVALSAGT